MWREKTEQSRCWVTDLCYVTKNDNRDSAREKESKQVLLFKEQCVMSKLSVMTLRSRLSGQQSPNVQKFFADLIHFHSK